MEIMVRYETRAVGLVGLLALARCTLITDLGSPGSAQEPFTPLEAGAPDTGTLNADSDSGTDAGPDGASSSLAVVLRATTSPTSLTPYPASQRPTDQRIGVYSVSLVPESGNAIDVFRLPVAQAIEASLNDQAATTLAMVPTNALPPGRYVRATMGLAYMRYDFAANYLGVDNSALPNTPCTNILALSGGAMSGAVLLKTVGTFLMTCTSSDNQSVSANGTLSVQYLAEYGVPIVTPDTSPGQTLYSFAIDITVGAAPSQLVFEVNSYEDLRWVDGNPNGFLDVQYRSSRDITFFSSEQVYTLGNTVRTSIQP